MGRKSDPLAGGGGGINIFRFGHFSLGGNALPLHYLTASLTKMTSSSLTTLFTLRQLLDDQGS